MSIFEKNGPNDLIIYSKFRSDAINFYCIKYIAADCSSNF